MDRPDARGLFPCFYVPQESLPSKKDSPNMYLLVGALSCDVDVVQLVIVTLIVLALVL